MNPVELLLRAKELASKEPFDLRALAALFEESEGLLEAELTGAWVLRHVPHARIFEWLEHPDPLERAAAVRFAERLGSPGARFLRHAVKDAHASVASLARSAARRLELRDVAPRDRDTKARFGARTPYEIGQWNVTGWNAGLWPPHSARSWPRTGRALWLGNAKKAPELGSTPDALLAKLRLSQDDLRRLGRPLGGAGAGYVEFQIPKRKGLRTIAAPKKQLKAAQRWLLDNALSRLQPHAAAHGFRAGHSIVSNARAHVGAGLVVKLDLQDFFPSVHFRRVEGLMLSYGYPEEVARVVARLTTYRPKLPDGRASWPGVLPQGAPTSPAIANLISRRLDARLTGLAKKFAATYTRYADDLTFSFKEAHPPKLGRFLWWVNAICQQEGFVENASKRRFLRKGGRQEVTGLVVNDKVSVPRHVRRRFRAILHNAKRNGLAAEARGKDVAGFAAWLHGMAAFIAMVHPEEGKQQLAEVKELIARRPA